MIGYRSEKFFDSKTEIEDGEAFFLDALRQVAKVWDEGKYTTGDYIQVQIIIIGGIDK